MSKSDDYSTATQERAAIAAWLRKHGYRQLADQIEAREHLK